MPAESGNIQTNRLVEILLDGYDRYFETFTAITRRARLRFENRDWSGMRADTVERLNLYPLQVADAVEAVRDHFDAAATQPELWRLSKTAYITRAEQGRDVELAATFFNSVNRKILATVGFDPELAFRALPAAAVALPPASEMMLTSPVSSMTAQTIESMLAAYGFETPFADIEENTAQCAQRINALAGAMGGAGPTIRIELLQQPFFRGMGAYLVGRLHCGADHSPLVLALHNSSRGLYIDAVLSRVDEIRIMFSFSRAYFQVEAQHPSTLAAYLKTLMPGKRRAEIYIGLGFHKHGKTELYRDLLQHQKMCGQDQFDFSPGKRGMVMIAFNMPGDDLIYKLIRDRFDSPKKTTAKQVMQKYDYVFKHDRAGRLLDVQTFENLELDECCFTQRLLEEIRSEAQQAASRVNGHVVLHHAYVERRVTPLDVYLETAGIAEAEAAVIDFGRAIKDLARINVFPGDMLIKNFGVTSLGRVVFYDYDELGPLTNFNFRKIPRSRHYEDEMSAEPWYSVGDHDVFPEEFASFLGLSPDLRRIFLAHHGDLFEPDFWKRQQRHIQMGTWCHIRPYGRHLRLPHNRGPKATG